MTKLAILGLGLIGGSVTQALDARRQGAWSITAWSPGGVGPQAALAAGLVATAVSDPVVAAEGAELTLLAAEPMANIALVAQLGSVVAARDAVLTDVTSVQVPMADAAADVPGLRWVGGHPMSGRERAGYAAADPELFVGRPWVILPGPLASFDDIALVERLADDCGARPVRLAAEAHDAAVALISHLPLVVASALVDAAEGADAWPEARRLSAQGWRDTTRLARGDARLGASMLALNAGAVADALREHRAALDDWQRRLDALAMATADGSLPPAAGLEELTAELERIAELAAVPDD